MTKEKAIEIIYQYSYLRMRDNDRIYQELRKLIGIVGDPVGLSWFCEDEKEAFKTLGFDVDKYNIMRNL